MSDAVLAVAAVEAPIHQVRDFEVSGDGVNSAWERCPWHTLARVGSGESNYQTQVKFLYSTTGIYFLFQCEDDRLSCTPRKDYDNIFLEDVVELFLWTDTSQRLYFEYEVSPLGVELPLLVANNDDVFMGWLPWKYAERKVRKATHIIGGDKACGAACRGWMAEIYIPFALLRGMGNCPPERGTVWRANMYRIDYDDPKSSQWAWCPETGGNFHQFRKFGTLKFV